MGGGTPASSGRNLPAKFKTIYVASEWACLLGRPGATYFEGIGIRQSREFLSDIILNF